MTSVLNEKTIVSTVECYDAWSTTYDSDGNILQLLDDVAFEEIAQPLLYSCSSQNERLTCCELGCGTGRNTIKVLKAGWSVVAVDVSMSMMKKAQERVQRLEEKHMPFINWILHDLNSHDESNIGESSVDAVISTLVLEHIVSLEQYFTTIYRMLKKNKQSWVFITAMHPNMYKAGSQAGFIIDETTGAKLCGVSFDHSIENIIEAAKKASLVLIKHCEKGVRDEQHAAVLGSRAQKWIGSSIHISFLFAPQLA